jgi:hypothetical protein
MSKMSTSDLKAMLAAEKADALAAISAAQLAEERADAMDYYLGDMNKDMPAQDGRSRAVSTDVADTIEGLMPSLMDIFAGSDEVVRFEPVGPEGEAAAQQETDYVNHVFMLQNPGFMVLYSFIKDALLSKVGIVQFYFAKRGFENLAADYQTMTEQAADVRAIVVETLAEQQRIRRDDIDAVVLKAVATTLNSFGIDEEDRTELKADFQHLRRWRRSVEQAQSYTFKAVITVIVTGFAGAVWLGIKATLGK